ncbi:MAG: LacI family DNA-binding transcriptional regulator [Bacteroidota bacterium]|nr:LacI family DNA-binding transcriptional regulator [Bacteroidota bacterium]
MKKQKVTIHDIARELNTTASTVSRALQDHPRISKATKEAVLELAQRLNYQPNSIASSLRKGKGNTIGIIIPRIDRQFFSSVIRGIEDVASKAGYNVMICQSYDSQEREKTIVENLINGKVDGLLVSLAAGSDDLTHFKLVQSKGLPLIFFDRVPLNLEANKVEVDDYTGAFKAVEHLILQGCRRIIHFCGPRHVSIYRNRFEGYKAALAHYNITFDPQLIFDGVITRELGEKAATEIAQIKPLPDGLFSSGDYSAMGAIIKFKQLGIKIPTDIAVVGFANEPFDDMLQPGLSSVDQGSIEMGHSVANLFLEEIAENHTSTTPKRIVLDAELLIRGSSLK